jgi:2-amino-4-hydroxy-6-hydroxymethyldihydropteridine diphosphokinase
VETIVVLSLGTNLGDKEENLKLAIEKINQNVGSILKVSNYLVTEPWGFESNNHFLNCCCMMKTEFKPTDLIERLKEIEFDMGRSNPKLDEYQDRIIDLDIIFYGNQLYRQENLVIPHKNFRKRDFVLKPLLELSNLIDPETFICIDQFTK